MPDTPRTVAELKTIFADNSTGDISAQDMRDFVESVAGAIRAPHSFYRAADLTALPRLTYTGVPWTDVIEEDVAYLDPEDATSIKFPVAGLFLIVVTFSFTDEDGTGTWRYGEINYCDTQVSPLVGAGGRATKFTVAECARSAADDVIQPVFNHDAVGDLHTGPASSLSITRLSG